MLAHGIAGFLVGIVARYMLPDSPGLGADTLFGVLGGLIGGFTYELFGHTPAFDRSSLWSVISAIVVAFVFLLILRSAVGRRTYS